MSHQSIEAWKSWAMADAERRGLHALKPLVEGLAVSTIRLRATPWEPPADSAPPTGAPATSGTDCGGGASAPRSNV